MYQKTQLRKPFSAVSRVALISLLGLSVLTACVSQPEKPATAPASGEIFYPPLPNPPRIQYLATFSSSKDVQEQKSGFSDFVLGKDKDKDVEAIEKPYGVAMYEGKIYAVDTRGPSYVVMDLIAGKYTTVYGDGGGHMVKPINITIDRDGNKYITDTGRNQILVFDKNERYVRSYGKDGQFKPADVAVVGDRLFVADLKDHEIEILDKASGSSIGKIGDSSSKDTAVFYPTNLSVLGNHLYISETGNFRIKKYTLDGRFIENIGTIGTGFGQFARPKGIALDANENLYVVDAAFENVQILNRDHKLLLFFGGPGGNPENINLPTDLEIDYANAQLFQRFAHPDFKLEYVILVSSQYGRNKVNVFGYGYMKGMDYPEQTSGAGAAR